MRSMIDLLRLAADTGLFTLVWIVQLLLYPSFRHTAAHAFPEWHSNHGRRIGFVVIPLMLAQLGLAIVQSIAAPSALQVAGLVLILTAWVATFTLSVPCHRRLARVGKDPETIERLIRTNWVRTAAWTGAFATSLLEVVR